MKKDENGNIVIKDNFFLRYFWFLNFIMFVGALLFKEQRPFEPSYPGNRLTWFLGFALIPIIWAIALFAFFLFLMITCYGFFIYLCLALFIFPFGFVIVWPWNEKKYINCKTDRPSIHPYRRYGLNDEKKFPAPWWFWLPTLLIWPFKGEYFYVAKMVIQNIFFFLVSAKGIVFLCIVSFILLVVWFFRSKYKKIIFEKIKEKIFSPIKVIKKGK